MRISGWSSDVCSSDLRALRIGGLLGHIFPCDAQLDLRGCDHIAKQFEPVSTFEHLEHEHWPDLDPALGGLIPPAPNREVHASVTDGTKRRFRKKRRVAEIGRASCRERVCQYV